MAILYPVAREQLVIWPQAVAKLGIRFPLARLLVTSLPEEMAKRVTRVDFVESVQLGDVYISIYDGCYLCISGLSLALKKEVCD